jgi:uncharacterized protein DUF2786
VTQAGEAGLNPEHEKLFRELSGHLALSRSPNEHEARNAAKKACDLIDKHDLVVVRREEIEWARGMLTAYQGCVMLAREEYDKLLEKISDAAAGKRQRAKQKRTDRYAKQIEGTLAEAAGDIVSSVVRGAIRRL